MEQGEAGSILSLELQGSLPWWSGPERASARQTRDLPSLLADTGPRASLQDWNNSGGLQFGVQTPDLVFKWVLGPKLGSSRLHSKHIAATTVPAVTRQTV